MFEIFQARSVVATIRFYNDRSSLPSMCLAVNYFILPCVKPMKNGGESNEVRSGYLNLLQKMRVSREEVLEDKCLLENIVNLSNALFKRVKTSSELKLDAKINVLSTKLMHTRMEKDIDSDLITPKRIIELFEEDLLNEFYEYAMSCYLGVKFLEHIPLCFNDDCIKKTSSKKSKLVLLEADVPKPVVLKEDVVEPEVVSRIKTLLSEFGRAEYFNCVVDTKSFEKTVENAFYLSLEVQSGTITLEYSDMLYICLAKSSLCAKKDKHLIIEISYDEYLRVVKEMGAEQ